MASSESTSPCLASGAEDAAAANGINGTAQPQTPPSRNPSQDEGLLARTPSLTSFSLTEYSAKPTPPSEDRKTHMKKIVPDEFLLPNGNPDVSCLTMPAPVLAPARIAIIRSHWPVEMRPPVAGAPLGFPFRRLTNTSYSTCASSSPRTLVSGRCATRFRSCTQST